MLVSVSVCALPCWPQDSFLAEQAVACGFGPLGHALRDAGLAAGQSANLGLRNSQRGSSPALGANPFAEVIYGFHGPILARNAIARKPQFAACAILVRRAVGGDGTIPVPP